MPGLLCGCPVSLTAPPISPLPLRMSTKLTWNGSEVLAGSLWILWTMWGLQRTRKWWIRYAEPVGFLTKGLLSPWGQSYLTCLYSFQIKYKKDALANYPNFTSVEDPPEIVLAKINSVNQSDVSSYCICWSASAEELSEWSVPLTLGSW